ncbi:MAG: ornithine carbamoyltransferase [Tenericutes bacterium GWC2_34_14]|nr:MAG: ornithine carbamoyltransferase [Tenericutes bacterium GWC2_34_14]OHE35004.1 MAG: ornithine carbamoyltransferase [Tenericutes bacterium GWE2_34_108]OHE37136.1 MAG: ornithine carbamoyltransferase [Tenericutes bacterium GWF1_35_14]OHE39732.1 MAG: ornithine carbamoyltransferase [Tenericutes bacterium GWF2_35_184]OHE44080.1 MAG: ornithine carbamoyltransferase [Tenericutes bacterium RIFOXYA2_FULL_36_32]OHE44670.1 MAG: ornithine carbamoyltransferase [Tenericutes bacterium RIFOXYA12_FULL_35_10
MNLKGRHLLTLLDYSSEEIQYLIKLAKHLKDQKEKGISHQLFPDKNVVLLFQKDSTRTRCAFEVGAMDLGMGVTYIGPTGSQMGKKESVKDTARVLGRMYDGIEFRGYLQTDVELLAEFSGVPVWNGLTDLYHPTQILADFLTIEEKFGYLKGIHFTYFGDARNNMGNSLMIGAAKMGMHFTACAPKHLWPNENLIKKCQEIAKSTGASLRFTEDPEVGAKDAHVLYTDVWVSMGEPKEVWESRIEELHPYQVNQKLMKLADKKAIFMHCLPAFHGMDTEVGKEIAQTFGKRYTNVSGGSLEVTDEVIESNQSVVFDEAENRMHTIKAVMYASLGGPNV